MSTNKENNFFSLFKKKAKVIEEGLEAMQVLNEKFRQMLLGKDEFSIESILNDYSPLCDETIIETLKKEPHLTYVAGQFILAINDKKDYVDLDVKFYFQDPEGKWVQKANTNHIKFAQFDANSREQIALEKVLKFEIDDPTLANK